MNYRINISETLSSVIDVEADNASEAIGKVKQMYNNGDIVLTADNFETVNIKIMEENND